MRESPSEALFSKNSLLNSLLAGNLRVETGSIRAASTTTQSRATGEFLAACEMRRIAGVVREQPLSGDGTSVAGERFHPF
jgi:hypothetical protein